MLRALGYRKSGHLGAEKRATGNAADRPLEVFGAWNARRPPDVLAPFYAVIEGLSPVVFRNERLDARNPLVGNNHLGSTDHREMRGHRRWNLVVPLGILPI